MADKNEPAPMTRPTLPGLVARWENWTGGDPVTSTAMDNYRGGAIAAFKCCAAELSQAVALSKTEREAIGNLTAYFFKHGGIDENWQTIRALLARLTVASDGGGKGEGDE